MSSMGLVQSTEIVFLCLVLLMEEILHHLGCISINTVNNVRKYQPQLVIAGFLPSIVFFWFSVALISIEKFR